MKRLTTLYVILLLISVAHVSLGQNRQLINGDFTGMTFSEFANAVEQQTDYHFFFKESWTDSLTVQISVRNESLKRVLDQVLANTDLHYTIDPGQNVFITRTRQILSELPEDFFNEQKNNTVRKPVDFDYSEYERNERQKLLAETKLYIIGKASSGTQGSATLAGIIKDATNGEPVVGAAVFVENPMVGVATDQFGYYALTLPKGRYEIKIKSVGMKSTTRNVMLYENGKLDIELYEDITPLKEVVVESERDARVTGIQTGMERLDIRTMKQMPLALGETDIMKVVLALPGVQSVGEGTVGLNVRGGATNQNLILFNDAVVYNPSHLFGFFSTFNPDVLKSVELYKSGIGAEYGGRLSSVMDVHSKEGNLKKFSATGGISPITGRLTVEGPLIKDRTSFIVGARSTYSDWILSQLDTDELKNSTASFYDITGNLNHKIDNDNNLYLSFYSSRDRFKLNTDTAYRYSDLNGALKWKHVFNNKFYGVLTAAYSHFAYDVSSNRNPVNAFNMAFDIRQWNAKADFSFFPNSKHTVNGGLSTTRYTLSPGRYEPVGPESLVFPDILQREHGLESAIYLSDNFDINPRLSVYAGLRFSVFHYLGERDVFLYSDGVPKKQSSIADTVHYASGKTITRYGGAEPRLSLRYSLPGNTSVKISYNRMRQYIQMLSNTTAISPTDIWKLSDPYIKPQEGDQISLGLYKNLKGNLIELSLETYYKIMQSTVDFKNGAELLLNHHLETEVLEAEGKAYGAEFMAKKSAGKLNGWISYTYSRSFLRTKGEFSSEAVNNGKYYPSNYDKPHAVNFIGNYKFSRRFNFSLNVVYSTGRPITLPLEKYDVEGSTRVFYSDRNQFRIPDYFRTDISVNIEGNHKIRKLAHSSWTLAVYNLTGRANAYSVYFVTENGRINGYKLSVFARPIPTITYNFKF